MKAKKIWIAYDGDEVYATFKDKSGEYECFIDWGDGESNWVDYKEYVLIEVEQDD